MTSRRIIQFPFICLLIISLLASAASAGGYVWCVTTDGHTALEEAVAGNCAADNPAPTAETRGNPSLSFGGDDSCGPCLDVPTAPQWGNSRSRQHDLPVNLFAGILPAFVATTDQLPEQTLNTHRIGDPPPRISGLILQHRTIVLLI